MNMKDLDRLDLLQSQATAAPWHVRSLDDEHYMSALTISTVPGQKDDYENYAGGGWPSAELVAATLIQQPRLVDHKAGRWEKDADLIVALRNLAPQLIKLARQALQENS